MKTFLFHILRTFRFVFVNGAKLLSALLNLGVVIAIFSDDSPGAGAVFAWAIMAVVLGMFAWYYDSLLRKLEPKKTQNQEWS